ncbi:site-specific integrase [Polynucleobacter sp. es-GGE-1]|uniref:site-specific integrase n=1 Tax=Polynucleobacter sp. es-GGE-1 TaxID=1819724 RepID=UPI001C0B45B6|nr:site-specific integrase [Polynucleobacter sp. es-GGE-1]MBU3635815.1 site-specific integrase [Polynucleobacter sp. es-GGE-1]
MSTISKLPSGNYQAQIRKKGIYRAATFASKTQAAKWAAEIESQIEGTGSAGLIAPPRGLMISQVIDAYALLEPKIKWGRTKTANLKRLSKEFAAVPVRSFNQVHIREFLDKLTKSGAAGVTLAGYLSTLGSVLGWAHHSRRINIDPNLAKSAKAALSHTGVKTRGKQRSRTPTKAELAALFKHWKDKSEQLQIPMADITTLAIETGMRLAEICHLLIEDCNWKARTVMIRDRKSPTDKHGNDQTIPVTQAAIDLLKSHAGKRSDGRVFPGLNHRSVSARFTRSCQQVDPQIIDLHFHDLRHHALTNFANKGLSLPELSLISGHKSYDMLKRYVNLKAADLAKKI